MKWQHYKAFSKTILNNHNILYKNKTKQQQTKNVNDCVFCVVDFENNKTLYS